ncbi:hypothetical protein V8C86DRAFT_2625630 [Haematococcus lacustris]
MDLHPGSAASWRRPHTTRTAGSLAPLAFVGVGFGVQAHTFWSLINKGSVQLPLLCSYCGLLLVSAPRYWVSVHQVRRLGWVGYPATCPTSSACG